MKTLVGFQQELLPPPAPLFYKNDEISSNILFLISKLAWNSKLAKIIEKWMLLNKFSVVKSVNEQFPDPGVSKNKYFFVYIDNFVAV